MPYSNSYSSYQDTQIKTSSPVSLVILLYDGAIKNIRLGEAGLQDNEKYVDSAAYLMRAVAIVTELIGIINPSVEPELAKGLVDSYQYVLVHITDALKERDIAPLEKAIGVMDSLRGAWQEVAQRAECQAG